ncbi:MAG: hypothetical protein K2G45_02875 [Lachnospiraceae bacterium]|nr:hypothetical protein [Lachnospiraceae bacterium]
MDNGNNSSFNLKQDQPTPQVNQPMPEMNQQTYGQAPQMNQQAYGQPSQMNQPVYGQTPQMNQPVYNQPQAPMGGGNGGSGQPPKVKKPLTGGKLAGIIAGGVAAVAAIVCGVIFIPKLFRTDKEVVIDAFNASFQTEVVETNTDDALGSQEIEKKLRDNGGEISVVFNLNEIDGVKGNATVNINEIYNPIDKLVNYTINAAAEGKDVFAFNLIGEQDNTYIEFVNLIDGYFMLPNNDMDGAINSSFLGELLREEDVTIPDINVDYFSDGSDEVNVPANINSDYVKAFEKLWDSMEYKKQGNAKIDVNGTTVKAKEYTVTLKEENIEETFATMFDGVLQAALADPSALEDSGLTAADYEAALKQVKAMIPSLITGDFVLNVYIKDDKVVKCTSSDDISLYGMKFGYDFYVDIDENNVSGKLNFDVMGEKAGISFEVKDMKSNPNGKFSVFAPDNYIDLTFTSNVENTDTAKKANLDMSLVYNSDELMTIKLNCDGNKTDHSFNVSGNMTMPKDNSSMDFNMSGEVTDIVKGTSYSWVIDNMNISIDGSVVVGMDGRIDVDTTNNVAVAHDASKKIYEVATLTQNDFINILSDNEQMLNNYLQDLGISGSSKEDTESTKEESSNNDNNVDGPKILRAGDTEIEILKSYAGTKCTFNDEYYISFADDNQSISIDYTLYNNYDASELVQNGFYQEESSGDGDIDEINVEKTLSDSSKVVYSYTKRGDAIPYVTAYIVKQIGEDCLAVSVYVYGEEISSDELAEILADANFKVK